jgi:hypothetical protein
VCTVGIGIPGLLIFDSVSQYATSSYFNTLASVSPRLTLAFGMNRVQAKAATHSVLGR